MPESLPSAAALWTAVGQATSSYLLVIDAEGQILYANRAEKGRDVGDVIGRNIRHFATPESDEKFTAILTSVFSTGQMQSVETVGRWLSGDRVVFSARAVPITVAGRVVAALVCADDVAPLKMSEQALHRERQVLRRLLEIQERERQLVSYEIHDGLAQYLAGAMLHLQSLEHTAGDAAGSRDLREGLRLVRAAVEESRRLISGLRPPALDELGIVDAVDSLVRDARIEVPAVEFVHALPEERLAAQLETTIFRIVQESLTNVRRHARARQASVRIVRVLEGGEPRIRVSIEDDGVGFHPADVPEDRFGLEGIRQRARLLGAEATITSEPGHGARIAVDLPFLTAHDSIGDAAPAPAERPSRP